MFGCRRVAKYVIFVPLSKRGLKKSKHDLFIFSLSIFYLSDNHFLSQDKRKSDSIGCSTCSRSGSSSWRPDSIQWRRTNSTYAAKSVYFEISTATSCQNESSKYHGTKDFTAFSKVSTTPRSSFWITKSHVTHISQQSVLEKFFARPNLPRLNFRAIVLREYIFFNAGSESTMDLIDPTKVFIHIASPAWPLALGLDDGTTCSLNASMISPSLNLALPSYFKLQQQEVRKKMKQKMQRWTPIEKCLTYNFMNIYLI